MLYCPLCKLPILPEDEVALSSEYPAHLRCVQIQQEIQESIDYDEQEREYRSREVDDGDDNEE